MNAIKGYFNGEKIVPLENIKINENQKVIITLLDEYMVENSNEDNPHRKYMGKIDNENCQELLKAVEDCEKVNLDEW